MSKEYAILWDCDGCLIDSEHIACGHAAKLFTEAGYPINTEEYIRRFAGQGKEHIFSTIES
jgi:beta-phosphoglucomutase-like phosphatase (HAD superfamily)